MLPLLSIATQLIPDFIRVFAGDKSGSAADKVNDAIKQATQTDDPVAAKAKIDGDEQLKTQLQQQLATIALDETKEQNRADEEDAKIDLEFYRETLEEKEREREAEFRQYMRDLQDRQEARSFEMQLAESKNPLAWVPPLFAFMLMLLIFYCLRSILVAREPIENRDVFNIVLGALVTAFTTVVSYYFGSSIGSKQKDDMVARGQLVPQQLPDGGTPPSGGSPTTPAPSAPSKPASLPGPTTPRPAPTPTKTPSRPLEAGPLGLFKQKAPDVMHRLRQDFALSEAQAAGILGNIGHECAAFRKLQEQAPLRGGRGGWGWCQWTGPRRVAFEHWATTNNLAFASDDANYGYLKHELETDQAASIRSVRRAQTLEAATSDFMNVFERPAPQYAGLDRRVQFAQLALREYRSAYGG